MPFIGLPQGASSLNRPIQSFKSAKSSEHYTYLIAGTHGDEVEGVYVLHRWFQWLRENPPDTHALVIVPVLNVDGLAVGSRVNANGVDLNRNYPSPCWVSDARAGRYHPGPSPMSEPENQYLHSLFKQLPPKQIITFHSWKPMLQYDRQELAPIARHLAEHSGYPEVVGDIDQHPTPGSLSSWVQTAFDAPVLTVECPEISEHCSLEEIWLHNAEGLKKLFSQRLL